MADACISKCKSDKARYDHLVACKKILYAEIALKREKIGLINHEIADILWKEAERVEKGDL
jgi:hypothetical protein